MPTLPSCNVLTHDNWKKARDKAGGKAGISKIDMGKALDTFHAALKTQDDKKARDASIALRGAAKVYVAEASKKYPNVAALVTNQIAKAVTAFEDALDKLKAGDVQKFDLRNDTDLKVSLPPELDAQMKQGLATILQETARTNAALKTLAEAAGIWMKKKSNVNSDPTKQRVVDQELPVLLQRLEQISAGVGNARLVGQKLERFDASVRKKYQKEYDTAVAQLATQETTIKSLRVILK